MTRLAFFLLLVPFAASGGDPSSGKTIVLGRGDGNCLLCHAIPGADRVPGNIGPPLAGIGSRLSEAQIRERIADASRFNPETVMPPYGLKAGLHAVAPQYRGKPLLTEQQLDDAAAFLTTLK